MDNIKMVKHCGEDLKVRKAHYTVDDKDYFVAVQWCPGGVLVWYADNEDHANARSRYYDNIADLNREWPLV